MAAQVSNTKVDIDVKLRLSREQLKAIERDVAAIEQNFDLQGTDAVILQLENETATLRFLSKEISNILCQWQRRQQLGLNGHHFNYDEIFDTEKCSVKLSQLIWDYKEPILKLQQIGKKHKNGFHWNLNSKISKIRKEINELLQNLIKRVFIVDKQPQQVQGRDNYFEPISVRLLISDELIKPKFIPIKCIFINEATARALYLQGKETQENDIILKEEKKMKKNFNEENSEKIFTHNFRKLKLQKGILNRIKNKKRKKKNDKSEDDDEDEENEDGKTVWERKYFFLFECEVELKDGQVFTVRTLSLPVVVTVNTSQNIKAWGTITWDNEFAEGRTSFKEEKDDTIFNVPDVVLWSQVAKLLQIKFQSKTGGNLTEYNLQFLAQKAFWRNNLFDSDPTITWRQFAKENLPNADFSFWNWFGSAMFEVESYLSDYWKEGYIIGFIGKKESEEMLKQTEKPGTFLIRFSETQLKGISIALLEKLDKVHNLGPYNKQEFQNQSLAEKILNIENLKYLYPDKDKKVFTKYFETSKKKKKNTKGYSLGRMVGRLIFNDPVDSSDEGKTSDNNASPDGKFDSPKKKSKMDSTKAQHERKSGFGRFFSRKSTSAARNTSKEKFSESVEADQIKTQNISTSQYSPDVFPTPSNNFNEGSANAEFLLHIRTENEIPSDFLPNFKSSVMVENHLPRPVNEISFLTAEDMDHVVDTYLSELTLQNINENLQTPNFQQDEGIESWPENSDHNQASSTSSNPQNSPPYLLSNFLR